MTHEPAAALFSPAFPASWPCRSLWDTASWLNGIEFHETWLSDRGLPVIRIAELKDGITHATRRTTRVFEPGLRVNAGDLLYSWSGSPATSLDAFLWPGPAGWLNQHIFKVTPAHDVDRGFLALLLRYLRPNLVAIATHKQTTALGHVTRADLHRMQVGIPPLPTQRALARLLGPIDAKIDLDRRIRKTLWEMAETLYTSYFTPSAGWRRTTLDEAAEVLDARRVPLSSTERQRRPGPFPYHGAAGCVDHIDGFLFDGPHVLVGEDGSVVRNDGTPFVQYVHGKFWVSNHAHVLRARPPVSTEQLALFLRRCDIRPFVTGAAQAKLSQGNLRRIPWVMPPAQVSEEFGHTVAPLFARLRLDEEQTSALTQTRDTLLPQVFSGQLALPGLAP